MKSLGKGPGAFFDGLPSHLFALKFDGGILEHRNLGEAPNQLFAPPPMIFQAGSTSTSPSEAPGGMAISVWSFHVSLGDGISFSRDLSALDLTLISESHCKCFPRIGFMPYHIRPIILHQMVILSVPGACCALDGDLEKKGVHEFSCLLLGRAICFDLC